MLGIVFNFADGLLLGNVPKGTDGKPYRQTKLHIKFKDRFLCIKVAGDAGIYRFFSDPHFRFKIGDEGIKHRTGGTVLQGSLGGIGIGRFEKSHYRNSYEDAEW